MQVMQVRPMLPAELPRVIDVWYRSLCDSLCGLRPDQLHSEEESRAFFSNVVAETCELWVAEEAGSLLGVLAMNDDEIDRLYVDTPAQGRGVGSALLARAKGLSPHGLHLVTLQRNERARRFYERHGFVAYAYGRSPAPEDEPDVRYRWPATPGS